MSAGVILAVESSAGMASAIVSAAHSGAEASCQHEAQHGHAGWIVSLIDKALSDSGFDYSDIGQILVGCGPGSFTGVRVAIAAAKGIGLPLNITPIGLSSLAALACQDMACQDRLGKHPIISIIDSRRHSLFFQLFAPDMTPLSPIIDGDVSTIAAGISPQQSSWIITGHNHPQIAEELAASGVSVLCGQSLYPHARGLLTYYRCHQCLPIDLEPLYLAAPILGHQSV